MILRSLLATSLALTCAAPLALGCHRAQPTPTTTDAAPPAPIASPSASTTARSPRKRTPPPAPQAVELTTKDGVVLKGSRYAGNDATLPLVVLSHRMGGARQEWEPLLERLFPLKYPATIVTYDLRGHGESTQLVSKKGKSDTKLSWFDFKNPDFALMVQDLAKVIEQETGDAGKPSKLLLVGSDVGASTSVIHGATLGDGVTAVALVSPGAQLRGLEIYKPFGAFAAKTNLLIAARSDNTSLDPTLALGSMSKGSKVQIVDGSAHGAEYMGREHPEIWDDLADWVEARLSVEDKKP